MVPKNAYAIAQQTLTDLAVNNAKEMQMSADEDLQQLVKDGSWNSMISAHNNGQIFADVVICPYCFMGEESLFSHY